MVDVFSFVCFVFVGLCLCCCRCFSAQLLLLCPSKSFYFELVDDSRHAILVEDNDYLDVSWNKIGGNIIISIFMVRGE